MVDPPVGAANGKRRAPRRVSSATSAENKAAPRAIASAAASQSRAPGVFSARAGGQAKQRGGVDQQDQRDRAQVVRAGEMGGRRRGRDAAGARAVRPRR